MVAEFVPAIPFADPGWWIDPFPPYSKTLNDGHGMHPFEPWWVE